FLFNAGKVVVLDFGRVKHFSEDFVGWWRDTFRAYLADDKTAIATQLERSNHLPQAGNFELNALREIFRPIYEPYLAESYTFDPDYIRRMWRNYVVDNPYKFRINLS